MDAPWGGDARMLTHLRGLAAVAMAAGTIGSANAADKITIGMASGINQLPSLVAHAKGFFKEQGLDVENKPVARGAVALGGVGSGSLQFAESAHVPFMAAVSKGVPLVSVGIATRGFFGKMVAAPKNASLKALADFKGKRIGIQVGTGVHTVILMLLEKQGLNAGDFQFTNLRVVDMPAAMAAPNNTFDAVIGWEPGMTRIAQTGHGKIVIEANQFEEMAGITYPFLISTTKQYLKTNPVVVQKIINAYAKADKYIREHHDEAVKIYTEEVRRRGGKLTEDIVRVMLFDTARFGGPAFANADMKDLVATRDFLIKIGKLKALPPFEQFIDRSFGQKAEKALVN